MLLLVITMASGEFRNNIESLSKTGYPEKLFGGVFIIHSLFQRSECTHRLIKIRVLLCILICVIDRISPGFGHLNLCRPFDFYD